VFGMTVLVGHTGAEAVWVTRSLDSEAAEDSLTPAPSGSAAATGGLDLTVVAQHNSASDCWSAISGNVYDLTAWIPQHPGGSGVIENMCGRDGTRSYNGQHQGDATADAVLTGFLVGPLGGPLPGSSAAASPATSATATAAAPASSAAASGAITAADVAAHSTKADCWSSINANVYDLTAWIGAHPGGPGVIEALCGTDGTAMYDSVHKGQAKPQAALDAMLVGPLG
jgi:cytochrome b involved in lipid metabolism